MSQHRGCHSYTVACRTTVGHLALLSLCCRPYKCTTEPEPHWGLTSAVYAHPILWPHLSCRPPRRPAAQHTAPWHHTRPYIHSGTTFERVQRAYPQRAEGKSTEGHESSGCFHGLVREFQGIFRVYALSGYALWPLPRNCHPDTRRLQIKIWGEIFVVFAFVMERQINSHRFSFAFAFVMNMLDMHRP